MPFLIVVQLITRVRLSESMDCSPPGSSVHGILLAGILEWVAIRFCRGSSWPRDQTMVSCTAGKFFTVWATKEWSRSVVSDSATLWTAAYQASLSMGFFRQECWSGLPFPSPGDLPDPGSPALQADSLPSELPGKPPINIFNNQICAIFWRSLTKTWNLTSFRNLYFIKEDKH